MGSKSNPGAYDCYANALPDEPMFVLLARDPDAPTLVAEWANMREDDINAGLRPESDLGMVAEARECARNMLRWRAENDGTWRKPILEARSAPDGLETTAEERAHWAAVLATGPNWLTGEQAARLLRDHDTLTVALAAKDAEVAAEKKKREAAEARAEQAEAREATLWAANARMAAALTLAYDDVNDDKIAQVIDAALVAHKSDARAVLSNKTGGTK